MELDQKIDNALKALKAMLDAATKAASVMNAVLYWHRNTKHTKYLTKKQYYNLIKGR
jgi:hypothetical protein